MQIFGYISHSAGCSDSDCLCWGRSAPFIQVVKAALERDQLWANTVMKLRALSNKIGTALPEKTRRDRMMQWFAMGLAVGLKEDDGLDGCHWKECESYKSTINKDDSKLLKCSRCQAAKYYSKECQTMAWKDGHKVACKQMTIDSVLSSKRM
jgi:MYND finger